MEWKGRERRERREGRDGTPQEKNLATGLHP